MENITNFLRYPGSKRRMLGFLSAFLPEKEQLTGNYFEPFLGGGSVFFFLSPQKAFLSDINPELIDLYIGLQSNAQAVWERYKSFGSTKSDYHKVRNQRDFEKLEERAARTLYLNRTCFKGMWRHNQNGEFNVGYGGQDRRWVINQIRLIEISRMLTEANIYCCDFDESISQSTSGDFLFIDPPYKPGERELINEHYVGKSFKINDHQRLANSLSNAKSRGSHWAMTTSAHTEIVDLFRGNYLIEMPKGTGQRPGELRINSGEVLITSYQIERGVRL